MNVIMRDSDLIAFLKKERKNNLWTSIESEPLTYELLQHEILIERLKDPDRTYPEERTLPDVVETLMYRERQMLDQRYLNWMLTYDFPAGQIYVQSRHNNPREALNRVTLIYEKDLQTNNADT